MEWEVEQILRVRRYQRQVQYLIRWKGFSEAHDSWEPAANCYDRTSSTYADTSDCIVFFLTSLHRSPCTILSGRRPPVRYDLGVFLHMIQSRVFLVYDINLGATATTILSTRGVQIPIYLVTSATDSFRRSVVLFKSLSIPTSDLKSEFLCQSSYLRRTCRLP